MFIIINSKNTNIHIIRVSRANSCLFRQKDKIQFFYKCGCEIIDFGLKLIDSYVLEIKFYSTRLTEFLQYKSLSLGWERFTFMIIGSNNLHAKSLKAKTLKAKNLRAKEITKMPKTGLGGASEQAE